MLEMDLFQERFSTYTQGTFDKETQQFDTMSTLTADATNAEHYYYDFNSVFDNLTGFYPCLIPTDQTATPKDGQTLPRNADFTTDSANPSICN